MQRTILFFLFILTSTVTISAQVCCSNMRDLGNKAYQKGNYDEAIRLYKKGQGCGDAAGCSDLASLINKAIIAQENANSKPSPQKNKQTTPSPKESATVSTPFVDPVMVKVEGGSFQMGSNDGSNSEKPIHSVSVNTFYIGKYEVTQSEWRSVMGKNPPKLYFKGCNSCPVDAVSWDNIQEFLKKLNAKSEKTYRLPTEAEWEYAARGGNKSNGYTYSGSNDLKSVAWCYENSDSKTHPVGQKQANELGLHDMSGNVWEWCTDWYKGYPGSSGVKDYTGSDRVYRGGGCFYDAGYCRVASRSYNTPAYRYSLLGFRLAISFPQ